MRILLIFFLVFIGSNLHGRTGFEITPKHKQAYNLIIGMQFDDARIIIKEIKEENPDNVLVYHIENYIDFISIFISEEEQEFKEKEGNKDHRIAKLQQGDPSDPYYLFSQAEVHLQWAMTRLKFNEYFTAAREVNKAIGMLERNQKLFPDFVSNKKSLSLLHAVAGTIPDKYKGVVSFVSNFSGTIDQGIEEINQVLEETDENYLFHKEAVAIKAMVLLHLKNRKQEAWNYLSASEIAKLDNPMAAFLMANVAVNSGQNEKAISILSKRTRSPKFYPFYYLDLMLGTAKLSRLDKDADVYIRSYISNFQGQDYIKDAYRKLAWHSLAVLEDEGLYGYYMGKCLTEGRSRLDEDRSALKEAKSGQKPNLALLKARLLFDGGYLPEAIAVLEGADFSTFDATEQVEYAYRKGRIYQELEEEDKAIVQFSSCVNSNQNSEEYYGCSAALQLGIIYEQLGNPMMASRYFNSCLDMSPNEYKNSLHQKAKSGLDRLSSK